jgi:polyisoprenoid-binding protein YceI
MGTTVMVKIWMEKILFPTRAGIDSAKRVPITVSLLFLLVVAALSGQSLDGTTSATWKYLKSYGLVPSEEQTETRTYEVVSGEVQFISETPLERIRGVTTKIWGYIIANPNDIKSPAPKAVFRVQLDAFKTGIITRDRHMRRRYLETHKYPYGTFTLGRIVKSSAAKVGAGQAIQVQAVGEFNLHGVKKKFLSPLVSG